RCLFLARGKKDRFFKGTTKRTKRRPYRVGAATTAPVCLSFNLDCDLREGTAFEAKSSLNNLTVEHPGFDLIRFDQRGQTSLKRGDAIGRNRQRLTIVAHQI